MKTLEEVFVRLRPIFSLCMRRLDVNESIRKTVCVAVIIDMQSVYAERHRHRLERVGAPFVQLESNRDILFIFDTRLPKTPQQKALERMTRVEREDILPSETAKTAYHDGTFLGAMQAGDLELAEEFLQQRKKVVTNIPYSIKDDVYWDDDVYGERYGAYSSAISGSQHGYVELLLRYGFKLPNYAMRDALENLDGTQADVKTVELLLAHGGGQQVTASMLFTCYRVMDLDFDHKVLSDCEEPASAAETHRIVRNYLSVFRMVQRAFHRKIANQMVPDVCS